MSQLNLDPLATRVPHVRILLATYNGAQWLEEQLESIARQQGVQVTIVASDDSSTDGTAEILLSWAERMSIEVLPSLPDRFGSAHCNFLRLIKDAELDDADYFAFSDQDDIWLPGKILRGIECLRLFDAQGYSSNVTAFWPDGSRRNINKAQPLQSLDYLFGSPGPGCTFVMPRDVFLALKTFVISNFERLQSIWVHDWLIYAFVRAHGGNWYIDSRSNMFYRQHGRNEIGANSGWQAALNRFRLVSSGSYRRHILSIAEAVGERNEVVQAIKRLGFFDRLGLLRHIRSFRRSSLECVFLAVFILLMHRD